MRLNIKATGLDLTPSIRFYIEEKFKPISRLVQGFDSEGAVEAWIGIARITRHHRHGDVFLAEADIRLPKKILRAEAEASDARAAIDVVKDKLHIEIEKYKTRFIEPKKAERK
jgi:ribosomal subunit interface protein